MSRKEPTYAQLIRRISPSRGLHIFEGRLFRCGSFVEEADLQPSPEYPATPLLIEFAGKNRLYRGHRNADDIHILWQFDRAAGTWDEIARVLSRGPEWFENLAPIVRQLLDAPPVNFAEVAGAAASRVLELLDGELDRLEDEGRNRVLSFLWDQLAARLVA